jgi:periplasmic protein CpxP/Spy
MKKILFLLPGAMALILSATPMLAVNAQDSAPTAPTGERMQNKNRLNLTADQKAKMKTIRETTRAQIDSVLTAEQRTQLQSEKGQGMKRGGGLRSLNLSTDQKAKIKTIMEASRRDREAILTPAQLEQMRQFQSQRRANRSGR